MLILTACSCEPKVKVETVKVEVPVKCNIPEVYCDFNKPTDTEVIDSLGQCIISLKRAIDVCK